MVELIRGLVRPFISFCFVMTTAVLAVIGKIDPGDILQLTGIIVAFHFGERASKNGHKDTT